MATIVVSSAKVIEAAEKTIAHIKEVRAQEDAATLATAMQPRKFLWFNLRARTKGEAIKYLNDVYWNDWESGYAFGDVSKARKLLKLAQHGDPVTLNEEDVRVLF
jgi:hypothetical protein